jgi:hypothetical protein
MTEPTIQEQIQESQRQSAEGALANAFGDMSRAAAAIEPAILEAQRAKERYELLLSLTTTAS